MTCLATATRSPMWRYNRPSPERSPGKWRLPVIESLIHPRLLVRLVSGPWHNNTNTELRNFYPFHDVNQWRLKDCNCGAFWAHFAPRGNAARGCSRSTGLSMTSTPEFRMTSTKHLSQCNELHCPNYSNPIHLAQWLIHLPYCGKRNISSAQDSVPALYPSL